MFWGNQTSYTLRIGRPLACLTLAVMLFYVGASLLLRIPVKSRALKELL